MPFPTLKDIVAHAQSYGFIYPSSSIYDGLQAIYDYGPYGVELKRNLQTLWWKSMTQLHENMVGLDSAIMMHPATWKASGHVDGFSDPMVDHKISKKRYRIDHLIQAHAEQLVQRGNPSAAHALMNQMEEALNRDDLQQLGALLDKYQIQCPVDKSVNWTAVRQFNLMFSTQVGSEDGHKTIYLRPETAQGIFVNFLNVQKSTRMKLPFGIAQVGKAFRNEVIARQFTFRMREFEQMEMQFFIHPSTESHWFDYWQKQRQDWYAILGIPTEKMNIKPHTQLAHYASTAVDIEYQFPFGLKEIEGIHARGDFDLKSHAQYAKKKIQYFDPITKESYIPYVIETSAGLDRLVFMLLANGLVQEKTKQPEPGLPEKIRTYLRLPAPIAPVKAAIFPLKDDIRFTEIAKSLCSQLKHDFAVVYDQTASIGKRYARQDIIGTPYCITIDEQTLQDHTVTLRQRDTMEQVRMAMDEIPSFLHQNTNLSLLLKQLN